jgi:glycosyltransferase involved in cell wall biosynthesis
VRIYGIIVAWPPGIQLRGQGLGMVLAQLIAGLLEDDGVRLVIVCPGWGREGILQHLREASIDLGRVELECTAVPYSVRLVQRRKRVAKGARDWLRPWRGIRASLARLRERSVRNAWRPLVLARGPGDAVLAGIRSLPWFALDLSTAVARAFGLVLGHCGQAAQALGASAARRLRIGRLAGRVRESFRNPLATAAARSWYDEVLVDEFKALKGLMTRRGDVRAWLCPTAFWPELNDADVPLVISVPDLNPVHFPIGFAEVTGTDLTIDRVKRAAISARRISVYSRCVAETQLIGGLGIEPSRIRVIPHGTTSLSPLIEVSGTVDDARATEDFCREVFWCALTKAANRRLPVYRGAKEWRFILFPSQARPHKNLEGLLDAYRILLRRHLLPEKLVLTAVPSPSLLRLVAERGLEDEVIILPDLSDQQLAACYRLATVSISPTLAEGACPFMIAESLSVGTPVLVSDIPVVAELVDDRTLRSLMCFDPYRTDSMVDRIRWATANRSELLGAQRPLWERLSRRTWGVAARDYRRYLDEVGEEWRIERERAGRCPMRP